MHGNKKLRCKMNNNSIDELENFQIEHSLGQIA